MKVAIKVPKASQALASITMENKNFYITEIADLCRTKPTYSTDDTSTIIILQIDKTVQGAGFGPDINAQAAATVFEVLDNDRTETLQNFQRVTVSKFKRGVVYLVPGTQFAPLNLTPSYYSTVVGGIGTVAGNVIVASHFRYDCANDVDILNATSIASCITVEVNGAMLVAVEQRKAENKQAEAAQMAVSIGVPDQVVMGLTNKTRW